MKISKGGNSYKIKMSEAEYEIIKRGVFELALPFCSDLEIKDYIISHDDSGTVEDIVNTAKALKGVE